MDFVKAFDLKKWCPAFESGAIIVVKLRRGNLDADSCHTGNDWSLWNQDIGSNVPPFLLHPRKQTKKRMVNIKFIETSHFPCQHRLPRLILTIAQLSNAGNHIFRSKAFTKSIEISRNKNIHTIDRIIHIVFCSWFQWILRRLSIWRSDSRPWRYHRCQDDGGAVI